VLRVVFVGGNFPSLDLTFPPTGLSESLGGMEKGRGREGKGKGKGGGDHLPYFPPPCSCYKILINEMELINKIAENLET